MRLDCSVRVLRAPDEIFSDQGDDDDESNSSIDTAPMLPFHMNSNTSNRLGALLDTSSTPKKNGYGSIASNSTHSSNENNNSPAYLNRDSNLVSRWSSQRHPNLSAPDDDFGDFNPNHTIDPDDFVDSAHDSEMVPCNYVVVHLHPFRIFVRIPQ